MTGLSWFLLYLDVGLALALAGARVDKEHGFEEMPGIAWFVLIVMWPLCWGYAALTAKRRN